MHSLQSFVSTHSEESDRLLFILCLQEQNAFNICIFEREFRFFFQGVGLGVESVHHCHQELRELIIAQPYQNWGGNLDIFQ